MNGIRGVFRRPSPYSKREVRVTGFVLPVELEADESADIVFSARSVELLGIPAGVVTENRNTELKRRWSLLGGTVYGGSLLLGLFHIILFVFTRNLGYLTFAVYVVLQVLFLLAFRGIGFELFWPESITWHHRSIPVFSALVQIAWLGLGLAFITPGKIPKIFLKAAWALVCVYLSVAVSAFVSETSFPFQFAGISSLLTPVWVIAVTASTWNSSKTARIFASAFGINVFFTTLESLRVFQLVEYIFFWETSSTIVVDTIFYFWVHVIEIGVLVSEVLITAGLADQINVLRSDRERLRKSP